MVQRRRQSSGAGRGQATRILLPEANAEKFSSPLHLRRSILPCMKRLLLLVTMAASASPSFAAGASNFTLVNGTGGALASLSIRRSGTAAWKPLAAAPAARPTTMITFRDPHCAFDPPTH